MLILFGEVLEILNFFGVLFRAGVKVSLFGLPIKPIASHKHLILQRPPESSYIIIEILFDQIDYL